jgi:fermentation-respiration switch protein FrsA (DUF1100 family)
MSWAIAAVLVLYLLLLLALRFSESRLLYFPGRQRALLAPDAGLGLPVERLEIVTEDEVKLVSWVISSDSQAPWVIVCNGNAGNLSESGRPVHYAGLYRLGLNLLVFDYRGYGESGGAPSEKGLYQDAAAAYRYLRETRQIPAERIIVFGHSLGSAVAIDLVTRFPAAGLIVEGAFTSVVDRGQELYPFIPVRWIAASRFGSLDKMATLTLPKLFLHAKADEVIPAAHGRRLFEAAPPPKTFVELEGGHGNAFDLDSARYFGSIAEFLVKLRTKPE